MLTAGLIASILLSAAALRLALSRSSASGREHESARRRETELREQLGRELDEQGARLRRELSALREQVESLRERVEPQRRRADSQDVRRATTNVGEEINKGAAREGVRVEEGSSGKVAADEGKSGGVDSEGASEGFGSEGAKGSKAEGEVGEVATTIETEGVLTVEAEGAKTLEDFARELSEFFNETTHPRELLSNETFEQGVARAVEELTADELSRRAAYPNAVLACISLEALARRAGRDEEIAGALLREINSFYYWPRFFALRALGAHARRPVLARLLARLDSSWREQMPMQVLREFVATRVAAGEAVSSGELLQEIEGLGLGSERVAEIGNTLNELGDALPAEVGRGLAEWQARRESKEFLKSLGRVWGADEKGDGKVFVLDAVAARVAELETAVRREPARSVLLVGDSGAGKTALVRALAERLRGDDWIVFEAGAGDVMAGQTYIGQIEERVQTIIRHVGGRRVLWVAPNFHELLWAGRHRYSPTGVLDLLLPSIESGAVKIIGEVPSDAYEQLLRLRPKLRTAMQTCRVSPLTDEDTLELGRRWAASRATSLAHSDSRAQASSAHPEHSDSRPATVLPTTQPRASEQTLREALQLAKQYLGDKAAPGNLLLFLDATDRRLAAEKSEKTTITLDDLLVTLSQLTGLPTQILDEREGLDLSRLRAFFERRVLGQPEAVECLVERVAMIKAGLTDPTRPQGVFLFVGPTGTGKTEIAKRLAEFLFGSPERMIRLDMSELQTWESQSRILGEADETSDSAALVNLIRKQPFSVVLLDEFEKAHTSVWDLFLQVFDDGRLTDRRGNTADFRHSVIIMTSNLGATLPHGASVGFSQEQTQFAAASVERAVGRAFRREFVNRIDRVVVFRPLGRGIMRELLRKELNDVLTRRGLRTRQWAVEWDESAIDFLLEKGFTADLGARPLKRAVERYLLSPLALTIVNHQFPEGDQFLFVRQSQDGLALDVQFVDPDAPTQSDALEQSEQTSAALDDAEEIEARAGELRLEAVALDPHGTPEELRLLQEKFDEVASQVEDEDWSRRKEDALRQMQSADFWSSPARFPLLGEVEYMDRIEAGLATAGSLLARLRGGRKRLPPDLVARLAQQLYLLDAACRGMSEGEPRDAFLVVSASREQGTDRAKSDEFARRLARMYRRWAEKRRMHLEVVEERSGSADDGDAREYRVLFAISGYGAYTIIRREAGLHVLETPQDEKSFNRARASVRVAAQPDEPAGRGEGALLRQAERALEGATPSQQIVRRYREEPSPLVRDSARGWRTGRLERVLDGDFDLIV